MSQCINNSAERRITRAPARGAPRQTASAVRRCIIKRNYSSLPLINWVQLPRAGTMARHGEHSRPCQQSGCCSRGPSMCPPRAPCVPPDSGWERQAGAALPWWNNEVGELVWGNPGICGTHWRWKTPDLLPEIRAKDGGKVLGTLLAHSFQGCVFWCRHLAGCVRVLHGVSPEKQPAATGAA